MSKVHVVQGTQCPRYTMSNGSQIPRQGEQSRPYSRLMDLAFYSRRKVQLNSMWPLGEPSGQSGGRRGGGGVTGGWNGISQVSHTVDYGWSAFPCSGDTWSPLSCQYAPSASRLVSGRKSEPYCRASGSLARCCWMLIVFLLNIFCLIAWKELCVSYRYTNE